MDEVMFSSSSDEWSTPKALFDQINETFGPFDLDPCATEENAKAPIWCDARQNGLEAPWGGARPWNVFVNPPFCREKKMYVEPWIEKAWEEVRDGCALATVLLIPARTDTKVWHDVIFRHAAIVAFIKGRVTFDGATKSGRPAAATFPSAIVRFSRQALPRPPYITTWEQRK